MLYTPWVTIYMPSRGNPVKVSLTLDLSRSNYIKPWYKWHTWETPANSRSICLLGFQVADGILLAKTNRN